MIIKSNSLLEKYFGEKEFAFTEKANKIISEFCGKPRRVGDQLVVLVATSDIKLPMYSNSGSYVKVGSEIRGMMPESLTASFKEGEIVRYGEWIENPQCYVHLKCTKAKITKVQIRPQSRGHEYYEVDF